MDQLSLAVMSRSNKRDERRLPIHPQHIERIDADLRRSIFLERGYGESFGVPDERLAPLVAGLLPRQRLIADCDVILLPKPLPQDLAELRDGQILWGWPHCVQNEEITQLAIDRRLTLIAFEAMNHWSHDGDFSLHVLHKNNELAGYCSVLHALELIGTTGDYGRRLRAAVIGFGATGRGAATALNAHGVHDVDVLTHRGATAVASPIHSTRIMHFEADSGDPSRSNVLLDGGPVPMAAFLAGHDGLLRVADAELEIELRAVMSSGDDYASTAKPHIDWDDPAAREALIDSRARDGYACLAVPDGRELDEQVVQASQLLATVLGQDLETTEDGTLCIARRVGKDRVICTVDTQARHGHKTAARGFDGYKGHAAIDPDSEIITDTVVSAGNVGDAAVAADPIDDLTRATDTPTTDGDAGDGGDERTVYGDATA